MVRLGWDGLGLVRLGWVGFGLVRLGYVGMGWVGLGLVWLGWVCLNRRLLQYRWSVGCHLFWSLFVLNTIHRRT